MSSRTRHQGLARLMFVLLALAALGGALIVGAVGRADRERREDLLWQAQLLRQGLVLERVEQLAGSAADLDAPHYGHLKAQMAAYRLGHPQFREVALLQLAAPGRVINLVDSGRADSPGGHAPGQERPDLADAAARAVASAGGYADGTSGPGFTALVQVRAHPGARRPPVLLALTADAGDWRWRRTLAALPAALLTAALAILVLAGAFLLRLRALSGVRRRPGLKHLEVGLGVAAGLAITAFAAWTGNRLEARHRAEAFQELAVARTDSIAGALRGVRDTGLESLARFYGHSDEVSYGEFREFSAFLTRQNWVQAWAWAPAVSGAQRPGLEAQARAAGFPAYRVWARGTAAAAREASFPVLWVAPLAGNEPALGLDLGADPQRRPALEEAVRTGITAATDPVGLLGADAGTKGLLVFYPVYSARPGHPVRGVVVAALRLQAVLAANADADEPMPMTLTLIHAGGQAEEVGAIHLANYRPPAGLTATRTEFAFGRVFEITVGAGPRFMALHPDVAGPWLSLGGLMVTAIVAVVLHLYQRRRSDLGRLVEARTRELRASEQRYREMAVLAEQANASKSEFLANMSHEIRTPMNGVLGMAELLAGSELTAEQQDCLSAINRSGASLLALLNDILDFSKIEAGQLTLERVPFNLERLVFDVAELFRSKLEGRPVELLVDFDPFLAKDVHGDPGRLRQVLTNLVSNATKFTEAGTILVEVQGLPGGYRLSVTDTGLGIPPEKRAMLFNPLVQADTSTTRRFGGTGLGLSLVKRIVTAMNGEVSLESQEGKGTCVTVELPLAVDVLVPPAAVARDLAGMRILVVDDLAVNQRLLCRQLEAHGAAAVAASSGEAALEEIAEALGRDPYDAALVDLYMPPGMDGATFGRRIREDFRCQEMALVVLTSTGRQSDPARLEALGFDGYFTKPVAGGTLAQAMAAAIRRARGPMGTAMVTRFGLQGAAPGRAGALLPTLQARILLVEDNEVNQAVARKFLEGAGAEVVVVGGGGAALARVVTEPFHLVLMDIQLPDMDGFEATARIRAMEAGSNRRLPIVAMTAHAMAGDRARCLAAGMDDYLTKPINREALLRGVAHWVPNRPAEVAEPGPAESPGIPPPPAELELDQVQFQKVWQAFQHDPGRLRSGVIDPFIRRGEELLGALREDLAAGRLGPMARTAHALKGSSRTLAFTALGRIAERIEKQGGTAEPEQLAGWVAEAGFAFAQACAYLRATGVPPL